MKKTFVDACVLIAATRGNDPVSKRAIEVLDDPERQFVATELLKLEVYPKALYSQKDSEARFYEAFFARVSEWCHDYARMVAEAMDESKTNGLGAMDSLHVAAARILNADEFVTAEKPTKSIHRTTALPLVSLRVQ